MSVSWMNGRWAGAGECCIPAADRGATLGFALFESMLALDGRLKFGADHRDRLEKSCARLGWERPEIDLESIAAELLERNGLTAGRARLRLVLTAGAGGIFSRARAADAVTLMTASAADEAPESVAVMISPWRRNLESPLAGLKTANYGDNILALDHARSLGFGETIFLNTAGALCEAAASNVFLVKGGRVLTPPPESGCLPGVARAVVIRLARGMGLECVELPLERMDLENADEIFLTSAIRGPVPVSRLGGRAFPATPVAEAVRMAWQREICAC